MALRMTTFKDKLKARQVVTVINPGHASATMMEQLGGLGFDALFIDCEHGMAGLERVQEMCRAARYAGSAPIVRPEAKHDWMITRYLDAGAAGVMVPHIETADEARALVAAVRYARPSDHAQRVVIVMVESMRALDNLDEITAVDGVDAVFVGSGDLSISLGLAGQRYHPDVVARVEQAGRRIVALGKAAGTRVTVQNAGQFVDMGFTLLYENASVFMAEGAARFQTACGIKRS